MTVRRRTVLASGVALLAGCSAIRERIPFGRGEPLSEHVAAEGIVDQPTLGPPPGDGKATIVAFEDPSCPYCGEFERETFPELRSEYVDPGDLSFVSRFLVAPVQAWGTPAAQALEATYAREEVGFWKLNRFYYDRQDGFDAGNVLDETRSFLARETDLDADGVVEDARREAFAAELRNDEAVAERAEVTGVPWFFLFRDGRFRTELTGARDLDAFERALNL